MAPSLPPIFIFLRGMALLCPENSRSFSNGRPITKTVSSPGRETLCRTATLLPDRICAADTDHKANGDLFATMETMGLTRPNGLQNRPGRTAVSGRLGRPTLEARNTHSHSPTRQV